MKSFYTNEEMPQRSELWHEVRETCIGGSDVAKILGLVEKYEPAKKFWKRKTGKLKPIVENDAMRRGALMEGEASEAIIKFLQEEENIENPKITPLFAKHPDYPYLGVSFDGVDIENGFITEIKCPTYSWNFKTVFLDGIQDYYYPQVQLQLAVANAIWGIKKAYFASYFPEGLHILDTVNFVERFKTLAVIDVEYDPKYFEETVKICELFWDFVQNDYWDQEKYANALKEFRNYGI